jgi:hypothetical protein
VSGVRAARVSPRAGRGVLDPVENISNGLVGRRSPRRDDAFPVTADLAPGHYRRQYETAATEPGWGRYGSSCGQWTFVRVVDGAYELFPVLCDCWKCRLCGPRRAAWLKRNLQQSQVEHQLNSFVTLTLRADGRMLPATSHVVLMRAWNILRTRLRQLCGPFEYAGTVETTKRGIAHLHLLTQDLVVRPRVYTRRWRGARVRPGPITNHRLRRMWHQATLAATRQVLGAGVGSFQVRLEPINSRRAADYLAKYCAQEATRRANIEWMRGKRQFVKSRGIRFSAFRRVAEAVVGDPRPRLEITPVPFWELVKQLARVREPVEVRSRCVPRVRFAAFRPDVAPRRGAVELTGRRDIRESRGRSGRRTTPAFGRCRRAPEASQVGAVGVRLVC